MPEPLVSLVFCGRNDGHGGDFAYRASMVLNMLGRHAHRLGLDGALELVFVDWLSGAQKLRDVLDLTPETAAITTFLNVERRNLPLDSEIRFDFLPHYALNAGVRRANGRFVGICDCDTLYPVSAVHGLVSVLSGAAPVNFDVQRSFFPLRRYQVAPTVVARKPTVDQWETLIDTYVAGSVQEQASSFHLGGFAAAQLFPAEAWRELEGYDEHFKRPWGWLDNHLHLRALLAFDPVDLAGFGVFGFHMESGARGLEASPPLLDQPAPSKQNVQHISYAMPSGVPDWGLRDQELQLERYSGRSAGAAADFAPFAPPPLEAFADLYALLKEQDHLAAFDHLNFNFFFKASLAYWQLDLVVAGYGLARTRLPLSAVFVGDLVPEMFIPALYVCPHCDVLAVCPLPEGPVRSDRFDLERLSMNLGSLKFRGRWRTLNSWDFDAVSGAASQLATDVDLVVTHLEALSADLFQVLRERLSPQGVMLVFWRAPEVEVLTRHLTSVFEPGAVTQQGPAHGGLVERFEAVVPESLRAGMTILPSPSGAALLCVNR